jgi:divalent metal cation (Fe/Co/Zn/Cd) transporter
VSKHVDIKEAHDISTKIEKTITNLLKNATITIHIEPTAEETSLDTKIKKIVASTRDIKGIHNLSIVYAGGILHMTFHAQVHGGLSLEEGHKITENVEQELQRELGGSSRITVHIEPFDHFKLSNNVVAEAQLEKTVLKVLGGRSMARLKSISTYVSGQRRYINVDLILDSKSSVEEAHKIVSDVEKELQRIFDNTTVTVHPEPGMYD